jgi:hypothetical protein
LLQGDVGMKKSIYFYDCNLLLAEKDFCNNKFREIKIKPNIARIEEWKISGLAGRTLRSKGYKISRKKRKLAEEIFGWKKTAGGLIKTRLKGVARNKEQSCFVADVYNLIRMGKLMFAT